MAEPAPAGYPVTSGSDGIKIRPELMERERLYHCIHGEKLMLVYKDDGDVLNCYEVQEEDLVRRVRECGDAGQINSILEEYIEQNNLNN